MCRRCPRGKVVDGWAVGEARIAEELAHARIAWRDLELAPAGGVVPAAPPAGTRPPSCRAWCTGSAPARRRATHTSHAHADAARARAHAAPKPAAAVAVPVGASVAASLERAVAAATERRAAAGHAGSTVPFMRAVWPNRAVSAASGDRRASFLLRVLAVLHLDAERISVVIQHRALDVLVASHLARSTCNRRSSSSRARASDFACGAASTATASA